ncbi:MAG: biopolymer transporter ExbD [Planctomycetes bacterium]|nr:biopolymer transporter ExbD [Planctomycetota bacterium]
MRLDDAADDDDGGGLNLTPLIDVVFLLLIFFLAATTFAREEVALDLRLPQAKSGSAAVAEAPLVVAVFADGRIQCDGRDCTLEALEQKLRAAVQRNAEQAVQVRGDEAARFGNGLAVLDACRLAKVKKVDFAALPAKAR